jgi:hypothetical protein
VLSRSAASSWSTPDLVSEHEAIDFGGDRAACIARVRPSILRTRYSVPGSLISESASPGAQHAICRPSVDERNIEHEVRNWHQAAMRLLDGDVLQLRVKLTCGTRTAHSCS